MEDIVRIVISVLILVLHPYLCLSSSSDDSRQLPLEHRSMGPSEGTIPRDLSPAASNEMWPLSRSELPQIKNLNVLCEKNHMKVSIEFDRPFFGMIFSKGHYNDPACVYLKPGSSFVSSNFEVFMQNCGTRSSAENVHENPNENLRNAFIENIIIVQYDPMVQEVWDQARKLRCTWYDFYEKSVSFKPFNVETLQAVQANFLGDNVQCWMQIQAGKGPWANEVDGIVKIGQTMTMVLAIKDDENKFDMLVRNCVAHDGNRPPIQLVDDFGCVVRPKVMSPFQKVKNFGASASAMSYAYFQAFKFPDSMNVFFQCVIQVCRHQCPEPVCGGGGPMALRGDDRLDSVDPRVVASNIKKTEEVQMSTQHHSMTLNRPLRIHSGPPQQGAYQSVSREGNVNNVTESNMNARPRATNLNQSRQRRAVDNAAEKLSVSTTAKMIRVLAAGDVAFNLGGNNETVVIANSTKDLELRSSICLTMPSFVAGLIILIVITSVACLVAAFMFIRIRTLYHFSHSNKKVQFAGQQTPANLEMVKNGNAKV